MELHDPALRIPLQDRPCGPLEGHAVAGLLVRGDHHLQLLLVAIIYQDLHGHCQPLALRCATQVVVHHVVPGILGALDDGPTAIILLQQEVHVVGVQLLRECGSDAVQHHLCLLVPRPLLHAMEHHDHRHAQDQQGGVHGQQDLVGGGSDGEGHNGNTPKCWLRRAFLRVKGR